MQHTPLFSLDGRAECKISYSEDLHREHPRFIKALDLTGVSRAAISSDRITNPTRKKESYVSHRQRDGFGSDTATALLFRMIGEEGRCAKRGFLWLCKYAVPGKGDGRRNLIPAAAAVAAVVVIVIRVRCKSGGGSKIRAAVPNRRSYLIGSDDRHIANHTRSPARALRRGVCRRRIRSSRPIVTAHIESSLIVTGLAPCSTICLQEDMCAKERSSPRDRFSRGLSKKQARHKKQRRYQVPPLCLCKRFAYLYSLEKMTLPSLSTYSTIRDSAPETFCLSSLRPASKVEACFSISLSRYSLTVAVSPTSVVN